MPLSRERMREYQRKRRAKLKGKQVPSVGNIAEAHNINEGMKNPKEKPITWEQFHEQFPDQDFKAYIGYRYEVIARNKASEIDEYRDKQSHDLTLEFGTKTPQCVRWRMMFSKGLKSNEYYEHIDQCRACQRWYADQRLKSKFDLNDTKGKNDNLPEFKGYSEVLGESQTPEFPEDFTKGMLMTRVCSVCGCALNSRGKCPYCEGDD